MNCYLGKTFCANIETLERTDCTNTWCYRYLSSKITKAAQDFGLPITMLDFTKSCDEYRKEDSNDNNNS